MDKNKLLEKDLNKITKKYTKSSMSMNDINRIHITITCFYNYWLKEYFDILKKTDN